MGKADEGAHAGGEAGCGAVVAAGFDGVAVAGGRAGAPFSAEIRHRCFEEIRQGVPLGRRGRFASGAKRAEPRRQAEEAYQGAQKRVAVNPRGGGAKLGRYGAHAHTRFLERPPQSFSRLVAHPAIIPQVRRPWIR
jgi:hypothetical protein